MYTEKYAGKHGTSWRARVDLPPDPVTGKRRQKWVSAPTKKEAEAAARRLLTAIETNGYVDGGKTTLRDFLPRWLDTYGRSAWEPSTYARHAGIVRNHIIPALGHIQLAKLTPLDLGTLYQDKREGGRRDGKPGGLSPRDVRYLHAIMHQALGHAIKWGLVLRNVADAVDPLTLPKTELSVWNADQIAMFLTAAQGTRYYPAFVLEILTGLRRGELLGLRWADVDLNGAELTVRQALKDLSGTLQLGPTKTHRGRRPVALPADAVRTLGEHRAAQNAERLVAGELWEANDLVFGTELGKPIHPSNLARAFRRIVREAGLPAIRLHDLRHSHATVLLGRGVHVKIVSERLGHASTAFTMDVYSHVLPDMQREAVEQLDAALSVPKRLPA